MYYLVNCKTAIIRVKPAPDSATAEQLSSQSEQKQKNKGASVKSGESKEVAAATAVASKIKDG